MKTAEQIVEHLDKAVNEVDLDEERNIGDMILRAGFRALLEWIKDEKEN